MNKEIRHIITHSSVREYENDGDDQDRYYLPWRATAEAASRVNLGQQVWTILPSHQPFEEFLTLLEEQLLNGRRMDRLYTSDTHYLMDEDIAYELLPDLLRITDPGTVLNPYQATDEFYRWASVLQEARGVTVSSDKKDKNDRLWWGQKGAYHSWIDNLATPSLSDVLDLSFPNGFVARDPEEAIKAYALLGVNEVVLKPVFGAGGFRIEFCSNISDLQEYQWPEDPFDGSRMPVAVQERLDIQSDSQGERVFSMQFKGGKILGPLTRQKMIKTEWSGNIIPAGVTDDFESECEEQTRRLLKHVNPRGNGGLDIADVGGKPVILEVNGGRPTGAHIPKIFKKAFAPDASHLIFEKVPVGNLSSHEVWDRLSSRIIPGLTNPISFNKSSQSGVFPIVWLQDSWGMLASFGSSFNEANKGLNFAKEVII